MMTELELGPGWRKVSLKEYGPFSPRERIVHYVNAKPEYWVYEDPVPPLPTYPYTVIKVTWVDGDNEIFTLHQDGEWRDYSGSTLVTESPRITGFEVLAEPRAVDLAEFTSDPFGTVRRQTAKAVLDRVLRASTYRDSFLDKVRDIAREFGVEEP